jgi:enamine deaminase RidA (YjgF/YER057c/UK114 family)
MNVAWLEWIDPKNLPARACIEMKMADPRCLVEIQFVASK